MSGFYLLTNQSWMDFFYRWLSPYQLRFATDFTRTTLVQIDYHRHYRFELYRRLLPLISMMLFMIMVIIFIDHDHIVIIKALKESKVFNIWFGQKFTRIVILCYLLYITYGSLIIIHRFLPYYHNKWINMLIKELLEYHNGIKPISHTTLLRQCDQSTLKHINWTIFGIEIIYKAIPFAHGLVSLLVATLFFMQLYDEPPRTMLIATIETYIFINGITIARIIITASCWLFFISEIRCVYLQDRLMQLNLLLKNLHQSCRSLVSNNNTNTMNNQKNIHILTRNSFIRDGQILTNQNRIEYVTRRLMYFLNNHNSLCWLINRMNEHWSECNMLCMMFNIPNNAMMVNLLLFQKFEPRRFLVLFLFTVIQFAMATIAIGIIPAIHYYAIGCRQYLFFCSTRFSQCIRNSILSARIQLKTLVYVERVTSTEMKIGIEIAPRQPIITYASYWEFFGLYIGYFARIVKLFRQVS